MRSKRAKRRARGRRKEALKAEKKLMWAKLSGTAPSKFTMHDVGYRGQTTFDMATFYCPYVPVIRPGSFIIGDATA